MRESTWLKKYEEEVSGKRNKSMESKKIIFIIIPVMMLVFMGLAMMNGGSADVEATNAMMPMIAVFAAIMVFVLIMVSIGKKKDVTKTTRDNVNALLRNDTEVEAFDQQMSQAPLREVKINDTSKVFMTQDYVGTSSIAMGDLTYFFVRREDIAYYRSSKTKSTTANPLKAAYFYDICDMNKKKMTGGLADTREQFEELVGLLKEAQPAVQEM